MEAFLHWQFIEFHFGLDITHERSFCPKCNHKLKFLDMIPVFSYIFLGGKCRYCKEKIRIRYFLLEIFSGLVFLLAYLSYNMNFPFLEIEKIIYFVNFVFFYITVVLIAGIDKENRKIQKSVLLFGIITQSIYMLYLYIFTNANVSMYRYGMYLIIMILLFIIDTISLKKKGKTNYFIQICMFVTYILMYIPFDIFYLVFILSIFYILIYTLYKRIKFNINDKPNILSENLNLKIGCGFCISVATIVVTLVNNFYMFY